MLFLAGGAVAAEPPPPLTIPDLVGPRTLALQGGIGLGSAGNEALFLNPAALAARRRYVADTFYLTDRRSGPSSFTGRQDYLAGAVQDSSTTKVAAGLAYARALKGVETGTLIRLGLAAPVSEGFFLGVQGNYYDLHAGQGGVGVKSAFNLDVGAFYQLTPMVAIGGAAYNVLHAKHEQQPVMPRAYGVGITAGSETSIQVVADWRYTVDRRYDDPRAKKNTSRYSVGAEYLFSGAVPIRAGYQVDDTSLPKSKWWSLGIGYVSNRLALDVGYRQSTTDPKARTYGLGIKVFVPSE